MRICSPKGKIHGKGVPTGSLGCGRLCSLICGLSGGSVEKLLASILGPTPQDAADIAGPPLPGYITLFGAGRLQTAQPEGLESHTQVSRASYTSSL